MKANRKTRASKRTRAVKSGKRSLLPADETTRAGMSVVSADYDHATTDSQDDVS